MDTRVDSTHALLQEVQAALNTGKNLSTAHVPEEWLKLAAEDMSISSKGLAFLGAELKGKGYLTLSDGLLWLAMEQAVALELAEKARTEDRLKSLGAKALIDRADAAGVVDLVNDRLVSPAVEAASAVAGMAHKLASHVRGHFNK